MSKIQVFDPAMCCRTGVCGPEVDPSREQLVEWAGLPSEASLVADAVAARVPVGVPIAASVQDRGGCCGSTTRQVGSTTTKCC